MSDTNPCIHCGFCLPACPTYPVLGTEMDTPRGRLQLMEALASGRIAPGAGVLAHLDACLGCRACESACPSGVPYGAHLLEARAAHRASPARPLGQRLLEGLLLRAVALPPLVQEAGAALLRLVVASGLARALSRRGGRLGLAMGLLPTRLERPPALPARLPAERRRPLGRVALLEGCVGRTLFARLNRDTARLLARAGYEVLVPGGQRCCGALHVHAGALDGALDLARRNLDAVEALGPVDAVVIGAAGCGSTLAEMDHWLAVAGADEALVARGRALARQVRDPLELLAEADLPPANRPVPARVAYHDACHLAHARGVREAPRRLLDAVPGLERVPLAEADRCCGSAGIYNLLQPATARAVLDDKLDRLEASGADTVCAANPGCLMQLSGGLAGRDRTLDCRHPLELLAAAHLDGADGP